MKGFGRIIKQKRKSLGYSQEQLSDETGLSLRTIQRIENGETNPRGHSLQSIASVLNISLEKLDSNSEDEKDDLELQTKLNLINSSALIGILIPYTNLFIPLIIWLNNRKNKWVDIYGRKIVNFQITWVLVVSLLLAIAPFGQLLFIDEQNATTFRPVLIVYIISVLYNVFSVLMASKKINTSDYKSLFKKSLKVF